MQQEISSSRTANMSRMSQITGLSDMLSSTPYSSIFFQSGRGTSPTPFSRSSSEQRATATTAAAVASFSRLMSEHSDLTNRFTLCLSQLKKTFKEAETLRQENTNLRLANHELNLQINLLLEAAELQTAAAYSDPLPLTGGKSSSETNTGGGGLEEGFENNSESPTSVIEDERNQQEVEAGRVTLPKSISIRSKGYLKISPGSAAGSSGSSSEAKPKPKRGGSSKTRSTSPVSGPQKVYVQGGGRIDGPIEMDVFNQGMFKTELCNKWQDTGNCPYGDHCQFAHGIKELRPVIRHPRYKTEVCRMVLAGVTCPYGHRCHFRHALTQEEQDTLPLRLQ
ncbi:zinc finger CCCH domain-containing protein 15-like [Silene latifolia]|uniref:zinc finger CCCH domain-containing protein 15-like n=1 Tax=Silene latifolia TaxID=37657 RepID=UPI003D76D987